MATIRPTSVLVTAYRYSGIHAFLQFHPRHSADLLVILDTLKTLTHLLFFLLVLTCLSRPTHSSQGPFPIGMNCRRMFNPNHPSTLRPALLKLPLPVEISEPYGTPAVMDVCPLPDT